MDLINQKAQTPEQRAEVKFYEARFSVVHMENPELGIQLFTEVIQTTTDPATIYASHRRRGAQYERLGKLDIAMADYQISLKNKDNGNSHYQIANLLMNEEYRKLLRSRDEPTDYFLDTAYYHFCECKKAFKSFSVFHLNKEAEELGILIKQKMESVG